MIFQSLKTQIKALFSQLFAMTNSPTTQGEKLFALASSSIGTDTSPLDLAPDAVGCAESVSTMLSKLFPPFQVILGTYALYLALQGAPEFVEVSRPIRGDIIISPTGLGGQNGITNGHAGIVGDNRTVMSNNSLTGLWDIHYTLDSWRMRYATLGGYPVKFFRRVIT